MDNGMNLLAGGALLGALASCWSYIQSAFSKFINVFVETIEVDKWDYTSVLDYVSTHYKRSSIYEKQFSFSGKCFIRNKGNYRSFAYETLGDKIMLFWDGWRPFVYLPGGSGANGQYSPRFVFVRYSLNFHDIMIKASEFKNMTDSRNRFFVFSYSKDDSNYSGGSNDWQYESRNIPMGVGREEINEYGPSKSLDDLFYSPEVMESIEESKKWAESAGWYYDRHITWKRGLLLYGPPGTGKTIFVKAMAKQLGIPIFILNLNNMSNKRFNSIWKTVRTSFPAIVLIEDFDNVFHGRENICKMPVFGGSTSTQATPTSPDQKDGATDVDLLNFDVLLNCIDGIQENNGMFLVITTNKIEHIDEALGRPVQNEDGSYGVMSTRPGRLDKALKLDYMSTDNKIKLAKKIFQADRESYDEYISTIVEGSQETPAQVQEKCRQLALNKFFQEKKKIVE